MKRKFIAAMHLSVKQIGKLKRTSNAVAEGLSNNTAIYVTPDVPVADLRDETVKLETLDGEAKAGGSAKVAERNGQAEVVFGMLLDELNYVNRTAKNDRTKILLSGFDASVEPAAMPVPEQIVIKSIKDFSEEGTAKIMIENPQKRNFYKVQARTLDAADTASVPLLVGEAADADRWVNALNTGNSRKLIVGELAHAIEMEFRVAAYNTHGQGKWSDPMTFLPR